ncbi:MAG: sugar transferase, partial [Muribaculaceae bacterium]|nr:sugar transferase [Muribaculaceae bacterium]
AILVRHSSPGPVIYSQVRIGYRQRPFDIYKFRSMRQDAESEGPRLSSEADTRVTPLGRVMRKYRLDELPQFWNVLKGDMSLVGPRPEREFFIRQIVRKAPYYTLVHQVRPGITSWGMVKYGYASTIEQMVERTRFDLIYLSNMSTLVDFKIMIYTVKTILTGRGV